MIDLAIDIYICSILVILVALIYWFAKHGPKE